jgi:histidine triad (HIT) family protein
MTEAPSAPDSCLFCKIAQHRVAAHIVYEDEATVAFLDLFPYTRGHLLVVPKRHGIRLSDLPATDQAALIRAVAELGRRLERLTSDYNVGLNAGAKAGQVVFHVHFHIIPRYSEENPFDVPDRVRLTDSEARSLLSILSPA